MREAFFFTLKRCRSRIVFFLKFNCDWFGFEQKEIAKLRK